MYLCVQGLIYVLVAVCWMMWRAEVLLTAVPVLSTIFCARFLSFLDLNRIVHCVSLIYHCLSIVFDAGRHVFDCCVALVVQINIHL
jgi:hypothetical protein